MSTNTNIEKNEIKNLRRAEWKRKLKPLKNNTLFFIGVVLLVAWIFIIIFAPLIAPYHPTDDQNVIDGKYLPPSSEHLFGTDSLGRDVFSRVVYGARISLPSAVVVVVFSCIIGVTIGAVAGYIGGKVDEILMRFTDLILAFPTIILAMAIAAALGNSLTNTIIAMLCVWWPQYARVMRSLVISLKESEFVMAENAVGASHREILWTDILPNTIGPIVVLISIDFGKALLMVSSLSYLGLGVTPPTPELGAMVSEGSKAMNYWWIGTFPGLAILTMALGGNFIGDGLRDVLDPKSRKTI